VTTLPPTTLSVSDRLARLTPEQRARLLAAQQSTASAPTQSTIPRRSGPQDRAPLSPAQRRFWFLQAMDDSGHAYNSAAALHIQGPLEPARLQAALTAVVAHHEALRTVIPAASDGNEPQQHILPPGLVHLPQIDLRQGGDETVMLQLRQLRERPFDLTHSLSRYALIQRSSGDWIFVFCLHHLVADGWSFGVFMRDLQSAYSGQNLPAQAICFADVAAWQEAQASQPRHQAQLAWWVQQLDNAPPPLALPVPSLPQTGVGLLHLALPTDLNAQLRSFASQHPGATPFVVLLGVVNAWVSRFTCHGDDVTVCTSVAQRDNPQVRPLIGNLADVLLLRTTLAGQPSFAQLVQRVRDGLMDAHVHADATLADVLDACENEALAQGAPAANHPKRPPADVLMSFLNVPQPAWAQDDLSFSLLEIPADAQDFALSLSFHDNADGLSGLLSYQRARLDDAAAHQLAAQFVDLLQQALANPQARLTHHAQTAQCRGAEISQALLLIPEVSDAYVRIIQETINSGAYQTVAYVVLEGSAHTERMQALAAQLPPDLQPDAWCPVSRIPLDAQGHINQALLRRVPVLDAPLCQALERQYPGSAAFVLPVTDPLVMPVLKTTPGAPFQATDEPGIPAIADGGALTHIPGHAPTSLPAALQATAHHDRNRQHGIRYVGQHLQAPSQFQSYEELLAQASLRWASLRVAGLQSDKYVVLSFANLREHITTFWACLLGGAIPVSVAVATAYDNGNAVATKLRNAWQHLGCPPVLTTQDVADAMAPWAAGQQGPMRVWAVDSLPSATPPPDIAPPTQPVAFIQLSSGSTGTPKCIPVTNKGVLQHCWAALQSSGLAATDVTLNWLSLDHVVPLLMCHVRDVVLGRSQIIAAPAGVLEEPLYWLDLIAHYRVTHTWSPNFAFRLVSQRLDAVPDRHWDLSRVVRFVNAGEQVTARVVTEFLQKTAPFGVHPNAVCNEYGMAELCTAMTFGAAFNPATSVHRYLKSSLAGQLVLAAVGTPEPQTASFVSAGKPTPGVRVRIAAPDGSTVAERCIGRLQVQGPVVTPGYIDHAEANAQAFADAGWFDTGDLGFLSGGCLTLTGRAKEMIVVRGANFYCYEIEDLVNALPGVRPGCVACCAVADPHSGTDGLAVFYVPTPDADSAANAVQMRAMVGTALAQALGLHAQVCLPLTHNEFPKTTSGKIQRSQLAQQLKDGVFAQRLADTGQAVTSDAPPAWFATPLWRPAQHRQTATPLLQGPHLLLTDSHGLADALLASDTSSHWIRVDTAASLAVVGPLHWQLDTRDTQQLMQLHAQLAELNLLPHQITDLRGYQRTASLASDVSAALQNTQSLCRTWLNETHSVKTVHFIVFKPNQPCASVNTAQAAIESISKAIAVEHNVSTRTIALPGEQVAQEATWLALELQEAAHEPHVALLAGQRHVPRLAMCSLQGAGATQGFAFYPGVTCLVTGGLGGLGLHITRRLLTEHGAHVLLVGRSAHAQAAGALHSLQALNTGQVHYLPCDVTDSAALAAAVAQAELQWNAPLACALHLAGSFAAQPWEVEQPATFAPRLAAKLQGTQALLAVLAQRPQAFAALFSSVYTHWVPPAAGLYAAANACLQACAQAWIAEHGPRCRVIDWGVWGGLGMSQGSVDQQVLRSNTGLLSISADAGWQSLQWALSSPHPQVLVGLDSSHPRIRRALQAAPLRRQMLVLATDQATPIAAIADRLGTAVTVRHLVTALPRDAHGHIDRAALLATVQRALNGDNDTPAYKPPQTPTETTLAALWQTLLQVPRVGREDNFFALGGHSLLTLQLLARIRQQFDADLPPRTVFEAPSLQALAEQIDGGRAAQAGTVHDENHKEFEEGLL
jgi:nonribosomal peptide synthetase DhbF